MRLRYLIILCACALRVCVRAENVDSLYETRLHYLPFEIEMTYRPVVSTYIQRYLKNEKQIQSLMSSSENYFPMIWEELDKHQLPYELCYLPVIESMLNPSARSKMGAAGLWQFMPATGRLYGLTVNSKVDERMDPQRSTEAACAYLNRLYSDFKDWHLVLTAYNCGSGNVRKAIEQSGGKRDFWSIYPFLPVETRNFLPHFMAVCYVMNFADLHFD